MSQKRRADAAGSSAKQNMQKKMRRTHEQQRMQHFVNTSSGHSYTGNSFLVMHHKTKSGRHNMVFPSQAKAITNECFKLQILLYFGNLHHCCLGSCKNAHFIIDNRDNKLIEEDLWIQNGTEQEMMEARAYLAL